MRRVYPIIGRMSGRCKQQKSADNSEKVFHLLLFRCDLFDIIAGKTRQQYTCNLFPLGLIKNYRSPKRIAFAECLYRPLGHCLVGYT